jgi:hypothetical protein
MRSVGGVILVLAAVAAGCISAGPGDRRVIHAKGNYAHRGSGASLPRAVGLFERKLITEYGGDPNDLGALYSSKRAEDSMQVSVFLAPAGQAFPGRLKQEFVERVADLRRGRKGRSPRETRVLRAPGGTGRALGYEASYLSGPAKAEVRTLLRVFQCGQWFFRIQVSVLEKEAAQVAPVTDEFQTAISCEEIADHSPAGDTLEMSIEPGVADRPEWVAYAQGQIDWLRKNVSASRLALGIPDHELDLFVYAWKRALDVRRSQPDPVPDPLFDALERARQAGFLEEYLWSEHLPFLTPPIELDMEGYQAWRMQLGITAAYQIRAGAVLVRSQP